MIPRHKKNLAKLALFLNTVTPESAECPVKFNMCHFFAHEVKDIGVELKYVQIPGPGDVKADAEMKGNHYCQSCGCALGFAVLAGIGKENRHGNWFRYASDEFGAPEGSKAWMTMFHHQWPDEHKFAAKRIAWWIETEKALNDGNWNKEQGCFGYRDNMWSEAGLEFNNFEPDWNKIKELVEA